MSFGGTTRTNIEFDISAPGAGLIEDLNRQIDLIRNNLNGVQMMYADGAITVRQYIGQTRNLEKQLKSLLGSYDQIKAGIAASNAAIANSGQGASAWASVIQNATQTGKDYAQQLNDTAALQARLGQMEQQSAREAAEAQAMFGNATRTTTAQVHDQAGEIQRAAIARRQAAKDASMLAREERGLADALDLMAQHEATATRAIDASAMAHGRAAKAARVAGDANQEVSHKGQLGLIQLGYAIDDIQYGMRGVGNNLIQFAAQIGGVFSGAATIVIASATVIYNQWDNILAALGDSIRTTTNDIDTLKRHIETLEKKPTKFAFDLTELDRARQKLDDLETRRAAFEAASKAMTDTQGKVAANVREAVVEHAGGTDLVSGTANLAGAIAEKQKQEGTFYTGEDKTQVANQEAAIKRLQNLVDNPTAETDASTHAFQMIQLEKAKRELGLLKQQVDKKAMERIEVGLIGGALKGIDADRKRLLDIVNSDPEAFAKRGIGDQFRADLITGSAANVRNQSQDAITQARDRRNAASDKQINDAKQKLIDDANKEADQLNQQGIDNQVAAEQAAQRAKDEAQAEHDRQVSDAAKRFGAPTKGDLETAVTGRIAAGQDADAIKAGLTPQLTARIARNGGGAISGEVAAQIVAEVMADVDAKLAAIDGDRKTAAGELAKQQAGKLFDAENRANKAADRRDEQVMAAQLAQQFQMFGANAGQAQSMTRQTLQLMHKGVQLNQAMLVSWQNQQQQIFMLNARMNGIGRQIGRRPGGNWRPGRTQ